MCEQMSFERALDLVWDQVVQEDKENCTPEFRATVEWVVKTIRGED